VFDRSEDITSVPGVGGAAEAFVEVRSPFELRRHNGLRGEPQVEHRKQRDIPPPELRELLDPVKQVGLIQQMIAYCEKHGIGK
jgi:hypothetical protein